MSPFTSLCFYVLICDFVILRPVLCPLDEEGLTTSRILEKLEFFAPSNLCLSLFTVKMFLSLLNALNILRTFIFLDVLKVLLTFITYITTVSLLLFYLLSSQL